MNVVVNYPRKAVRGREWPVPCPLHAGVHAAANTMKRVIPKGLGIHGLATEATRRSCSRAGQA
mgnify:CR=1 FL=1